MGVYTYNCGAGHFAILMLSGEDKPWRQEVLKPLRLTPFSPSALHFSFTSRSLKLLPVRQTVTRGTASTCSFLLSRSKVIGLACISLFHHHLTPKTLLDSSTHRKDTARISTTVFKSTNAIMASSKPRLVDTLPSVRTRPMKVIVLGLNRTGTMCMFFFPNLSPSPNLNITHR